MKMTRKIFCLLLIAALALSLGVLALAKSETLDDLVTYRGITVTLNDTPIALLGAGERAVEPFIYKDSTYLPLRAIGYSLGLKVGWDNASGVVTLDDGGTVKIGSGTPLKSSGSEWKTIVYRDIKLKVNGEAVTPIGAGGATVEPFMTVDEQGNGTVYLPLRAVANLLGLEVGWDGATSVVTLKSEPISNPKKDPEKDPEKDPADKTSEAVKFEHKDFALVSGDVSADVLTVDTADPSVSIRSAMVNGTIGATAKFEDIAKNSGAYAVVNGNFFEAYQDFKRPIGHVMVNGTFLYGVTGLPALCIREDGTAEIARPSVFFGIRYDGTREWACYEKNNDSQSYWNSVMYTSAWGSELEITCDGTVTVVENGVITSSTQMKVGDTVKIPKNGFVMHFGGDFTSTSYYRAPVVGTAVTEVPYIRVEDPVGFNLNGMKTIVSGAPTLVRNGKIETALEDGFTEARFTDMTTPRTAVGVKNDGKVVIVSVPAATIQQMRELMFALGCKDAINLDGGASCAMYVDGSVIRPAGRELTVTLQVFVK